MQIKKRFLRNVLSQGWANSGLRATCGRPQRLQWPTEALRKILKSEISTNSSQYRFVLRLPWTETCFNCHYKVRPSVIRGLFKVAHEPN